MQVLHECLLELQCVPLDVIFWEDMAAELLIVDIKPETQNWTCRLTVVEKQNIRSAKTSPMKFLPLVLADSAGNRVQATAFAGDISGIDARLQLYSTYLISGAYVKPLTDLRFCVDQNYQYVWSFTRRTFIQDVAPEEGVDFRQIAESTVKPFRGIFDCYLAAESLSLMAVIVAKLPRAFIVTGDVHKVAWDVVLINEELTLVPMTIWEEFVNQHGAAIDTFLQSGDCPVLFVTRVVANIYQGLSLSTRYDSHMELNPVGDRALVLKKWAKDNNAKIKQLLIEKQYEHALENIACPLSQPQTLLASLETNLNKVPVVWVCGRVNLSDTSAEPYYIGCDYCNRRVYAPEGSTFQCMFCGQKQGRTVKRSKAVKLSSTISATQRATCKLSLEEITHIWSLRTGQYCDKSKCLSCCHIFVIFMYLQALPNNYPVYSSAVQETNHPMTTAI
ncbi:unnamed protein product [Cuscuta epithymum]|uniref:Replication factor A C-terminal domain-containing protein n=1 Tax=Cuscuta epithymum TaxID=186058 RepID=A0AAV0F1U3_9ASTE|nr:unnamed protein product [Cuscuta epithymum]